MSILDDVVFTKKKVEPIYGYSPRVNTAATMLFGLPKPVAMESHGTATTNLLDDMKIRQEGLRFVLKEMKKDVMKFMPVDFVLNRKLAKTPYTSLMGVEMLNPMGLKAPLRDYAEVIFRASEICKLTVAKVIPNVKVFLAEMVGNDELMNNRPLDSYAFLELNEEVITELKASISKMLDSKYENPVTTFGQQFKRIKDWEETIDFTSKISANINDVAKYGVEKDVKEISGLVDKLITRVKREGAGDRISQSNIRLIRVAVRQIAEEISFLGATVHLGDTLVNVMEDNKEFLRDFLV